MKALNEITLPEIIDFLKKVDKKTWIKIGIISGVALLLGVVVLWPAWFQRFEIRGKLKAIQEQIQMFETLTKQEPHLLRRKEETLQFIYGAKERLFQAGEASLLLGQISKLANESNVGIIASKPKEFEGEFPATLNTL